MADVNGAGQPQGGTTPQPNATGATNQAATQQQQGTIPASASGANDDFTPADDLSNVQKLIQSETDKVRGKYALELKALKEQLKSYEMEKLSEEEKANKLLQEKLAELEEREAEANKKAQVFKAGELLMESKIPPVFKEFLAGEDDESTQKGVEAFVKAWNSELNKAVNETVKKVAGRTNPGSPADDSPKDLEAQIRAAEMSGNFRESLRLKEQLMEQKRQKEK